MLAVLAAFAVAPVVAAPAYLRAADRVVAAGQVAAADPAERAVSLQAVEGDSRRSTGDPAGQVDLSSTGASLIGLPGFRYAYAAEFPAVGLEPDARTPTRLVHRQDVCAHLVMVTGRCLLGEGDLVLGEETARRLRLAAGRSVSLSYARFDQNPDSQLWVGDGAAKKFFLAGTYRVADPSDVYWGSHGYFAFAETPGGTRAGEPAFTGLASVTAMEHGDVQLAIDGYAGPGALDADRLPALRAGLDEVRRTVTDLGAGDGVSTSANLKLVTSIPALLARIDEGHVTARRIVPVPAVALVLLACLALLLAAAAGAEARRPETAVIALRGARGPHRWWLASGESVVAVLAGAVAGALAGQLLVSAVVVLRWPGVGAGVHLSSLRYAAPASAAAVLTVLIAQLGPLRRPVGELLRRTPVPGRRAGLAVDVLVLGLAVAAVVQLALGRGDLVGVGATAPALSMLAGALLVARLLRPVAARLGRRALRRGRLGPGLTGLLLARRAATGRVFALLVAAVAVSCYVVAAADVAARGRRVEADLSVGADRVLAAGPIGRARLLAAVRAVDPDRSFAMAAVKVTQHPGEPPLLAVDSDRLGAVAHWPGGSVPAGVAAVLHPPAPAPVEVPGGPDLTLDITAAEFAEGRAVSVDAVVSPVRGPGSDVLAPMGVLRPGRHVYHYATDQCAGGCRLNALRIAAGTTLGVHGVLTLHGLGSGDPAAWRVGQGGRLGTVPDGLRLEVTTMDEASDGLLLQPADTPWPLPVLATGSFVPGRATGLDYRQVPVTVAGRLAAVPAFGEPAVLTDLEYLDRVSTDAGPTASGEVWLNARAPADVLDRLAGQGIVVTGDLRAAQVAARLDQQGAAVALGYAALVGVLVAMLAAGVLVLTAAAGRDRQAEDLAALRAQGLSRAAVRRAALGAYPLLVAAAMPAGLGIALAGWAVTGWALPLAGLDPPPLPRPHWPAVPALLAVVAALAVTLGATAVLSGRRTLRRIR